MAIGLDRSRFQGDTVLSGRSVDVNVYGVGVYEGWFGTGYSEKRERKVVQGARRDLTPIGLTAGIYIPGGMTMRFAASTAMDIRTGLATFDPNGTSYGDVAFACSISIQEPINVNTPNLIYLFGNCCIVEDKDDLKNDAEELITEFGITFVRSNKNGLTLFSSNQ